jgi:hypothetical protein
MQVQETLTGLAKVRFEVQLVKTKRTLLTLAEQVTHDDLLPARLPDKVKKLKRTKPPKPHRNASARSYTGTEATEHEANKAEKRK